MENHRQAARHRLLTFLIGCILLLGTAATAQARVDLTAYWNIRTNLDWFSIPEGQPNTTTDVWLAITNVGDEPATSVTVSRRLPTGISIITENPPVQGEPAPGTAPVVFPNPAQPNPGYDIAVMPPYTTVYYYYQITIPEIGSYPFSAEIACAEEEADLTNNSPSQVLHIVPESQADIATSMTASKSVVNPGEEVVFTLAITNNGPGVASHVRGGMQVYTQALANVGFAMELVSVDVSNGTDVSGAEYGVMELEGFSLQPGETATLSATYRGKEPGKATLYGGAHNTMAQIDPQPNNNTAAPVEVELGGYAPQFDLVPELKMSPESVQPGGLLVEQLIVKNAGPDDATDLKFYTSFGDYQFSSDWVFEHDLDLHSITNAGGWQLVRSTSNTLEGTLPFLAAGDSTTVTLLFNVKENPKSESIYHDFTVESTHWIEHIGDDFSVRNNNRSYNRVSVNRTGAGAQSDVQISRTAPQQARLGEAYSYQVTATNLGPDPITTGYIANLIPTGTKVVRAVAEKGTASVAGNFVSLENTPLAVGESAKLDITVVAQETGSKTYSGSVASSSYDTNLANNSTDAQTLITVDGPVINPDIHCVDTPDLVGQITKVSRKGKFNKKTGEWNYKVQAKVAVTNIGTGCAMEKSTVRLYLSKDLLLDSGDLLVGGKQIKKLCPPKNTSKAPKPKTVSIKAKLAPGINPVGCYVIAVIDADNAVPECNEANNLALSLD